MIKKEDKNILLLTILLLGISLFILSPYILNRMPLTYGTDIKPQWFEFYTEFKNLLKRSNYLFTHGIYF